MSRTEVRRALVRGAWGSCADWRAACVLAKNNGWTLSQVERVLMFSHPVFWMMAVALGFCVVGALL
jgi:hypothetical protein